MSRHNAVIRLRHMRDYTKEAIELSEGRTRADLDRDRLLNLALVRLCEMIGEAASKVPVDTRQNHPTIPWKQVVSFRNRLIHGYDNVDLDILWQVVTSDLPSLFITLEATLSRATDPEATD